MVFLDEIPCSSIIYFFISLLIYLSRITGNIQLPVCLKFHLMIGDDEGYFSVVITSFPAGPAWDYLYFMVVRVISVRKMTIINSWVTSQCCLHSCFIRNVNKIGSYVGCFTLNGWIKLEYFYSTYFAKLSSAHLAFLSAQ